MITQVLPAAFVVMLATALGASAVLIFQRISAPIYAAILAFCAGMMGFSAAEMIIESHALAGHRAAFASFLVGIVLFCLLDRILPHVHTALMGTEMPSGHRRTVLLVGAMTLHNIPEGFAVAAAFAGSSPLGWLVTACIALQDVPEGLVVSAPMACQGVPVRRCFLWGLFSGFAEFAAAIGGAILLSAVTSIAPWALGFSAGAMSYVVLFELLPDALRQENRWRTLSVGVAGIALAYGLSTLLGS